MSSDHFLIGRPIFINAGVICEDRVSATVLKSDFDNVSARYKFLVVDSAGKEHVVNEIDLHEPILHS